MLTPFIKIFYPFYFYEAMNVLDIVNGHVHEVLNLGEDLSKTRLKICYSCPLYSNKLGGVCNSKLWLNVDTGDVSTIQKPGYKRGCGCRLAAKTRLANAKCPVEKW